MAEAIIKYSDLIEDDGGFLKLEKDFEQLGKNLQAQTKGWKNHLSIVDVTDTKKIEAYEKEIDKLKKSMSSLQVQKEKLEVIKKKSVQLSKQEMIALEQERIAINKNKAEAKAIAQIKSSQSGSIEQLRARLALITIAWSKLSEEERTNSKIGDRLVASKKSITEELKREEKATGDSRRNVGNYKESVKEAIQEMRLERDALIQKRKALKDDQNMLEESSAEYRIYQKEINKTESSINNLNNELNENVVVQNNMQQTTDKTAGLLTKMAVAVGGFQVLKSGASLVADFETNLADLSAVTGLTGSDLDALKQKSIEFSKKFGISASDIAEGFKLAGSARPELLKNGKAMADLTEKVIILSKASGDDFPTSMKNLTGTLNAFDLPATKASEVMDTLANASQLGTQEIPYLTEAFTKFGGVASSAGVSVAESASALEILGKKIPDASVAGNQMKNVLIKLQIEASKQGRTFEGFGKELERMKPKLKDITYLTKTFGSENLQGAQLLISQTKELGNFTNELGKTGTAQDQANIKTKTLAETANRLRETFKSYFLEADSGSGITQKLTGTLSFLSSNFSTIVYWLGKLITTFILYRATVKALELKKSYEDWKKVQQAIKDSGEETTGASAKMKAFGLALKQIGFAVAIQLMTSFVKGIYDIANGYDVASRKLQTFNILKKYAEIQSDKNINKIKKEVEANNRDIELRLSLGKITQKQANEERKAFIQKKDQYTEESDLATRSTKVVMKSREDNIKDLIKEEEGAKKIADASIRDLKAKGEFKNRLLIADQEASKRASNVKIKAYNDFLNVLDEEVFALEVSTNEENNNTSAVSKNNTELKSNNTLVEARLKLMQDELQVRNEIASIKNIAEQKKVETNIETELQLRKKQAEEFGTVETSVLKSMIDQQSELKKQASARDFEFKMSQLDKDLAKEKVARLYDLDSQKIELLKQENLTTQEKAKINASYNSELKKLNEEMILEEKLVSLEKEKLTVEYGQIYSDIEEERLKKTTEVNTEILDSQKNNLDFIQRQKQADSDKAIIIFEDAIDQQNQIIEKASGKVQKEEIQGLKNLLEIKYELRKRAIEDEYNYQLSKVTEGSAEAIAIEKEKQNELLKLNKDYNNEQKDADAKLKAIKEQDWQNFVNVAKKTFEQILDKVEQNAQKEVQVASDKISKQQSLIDKQKDRAEKGLTNSLAFEEKELAKAEANKIKSEKKLARIQKGKALYSAYSGYAGAGDKQALQHTLRDFAIMEAISLSFGEGGAIEDHLPSNGIFQGQSHKGNQKGIKVLVEGNEGIFSGREMKNLGKSNFYALKEMAGRGDIKEGFFNGQKQTFLQAVPVIGTDPNLLNEVVNMRRAFQESEKSKFQVVQYTKDLFKIIETSTKGNVSVRTSHEMKKPKF